MVKFMLDKAETAINAAAGIQSNDWKKQRKNAIGISLLFTGSFASGTGSYARQYHV